MTVVPNPADDRTDIRFSTGITGTWSLRDLAGRTVQEGIVPETSTVPIDLTKHQPGLYFITLKAMNGTAQTVKFTVQR